MNIINSFLENNPEVNENQKITAGFSTNIHFDQRFLCKIAIGVGYKLFGDEYLRSEYYHKLKEGLWDTKHEKIDELELFTSSFFDKVDQIEKRVFTWKGGILVTLFPSPKGLILLLSINEKIIHTVITTSQELIEKSFKIINPYGGEVFLVIPGINYSNKFNATDFISHKIGRKHPELTRLEEIRDNIPTPPSKDK